MLQGFPADATLAGFSDIMALQVGNAVPPPLTAAVGHTILAMDAHADADECRLTPPVLADTGESGQVVTGRAAVG